jgi:hypothetical protein
LKRQKNDAADAEASHSGRTLPSLIRQSEV